MDKYLFRMLAMLAVIGLFSTPAGVLRRLKRRRPAVAELPPVWHHPAA